MRKNSIFIFLFLAFTSVFACFGVNNGGKEIIVEAAGDKTTIVLDTSSQSYEFNNSNQSFEIDYPLSDFTIAYYDSEDTECTPRNVGSYKVVITRPEDGSYNAYSCTIDDGLVVTKKVITSINVGDYYYNGTNQNSSLTATFAGLDGNNHVLTPNTFDFTELGTYNVSFTMSATDYATYTFKDGSNQETDTFTKSVVMNKGNYDMSGIWFGDVTGTYDTTYHSILIDGELPAGVTVTYDNNVQIDAGVYEVTAHFHGDYTHYNQIPDMVSIMTISRLQARISGFSLSDWIFDQTPNNPKCTVNAPCTVIYTYSDSQNGTFTTTKPTNAGTYYCKATIEDTNNLIGTSQTIVFHINKNTYNMSGVSWVYTSAFTYDRSAHTVTVTGLPEGVTVKSYTNNEKTNAGTYVAQVTFNYDSDNYEEPTFDNLTWKINKAASSLDLSEVVTEFTYNGEYQSISGAVLNHYESTLTYTNNSFKNAGEHVVTISAPASANYLSLSQNVTVTVNKATTVITTTGVPTSFTYDGSYHYANHGATINHEEEAIKYENYSYLNAGNYILTIKVDESLNYLAAQTTVLVNVAKADLNISNARWSYDEPYTYDAAQKTIVVIGLPVQLSVSAYTGNYATNAGHYYATATLQCSDNNYNVPTMPSIDWYINKAESYIYTDNIVDEYTYTGKLITVNSGAILDQNEGTIVYTNNTYLNVGEYVLTVSVAETTNYLAYSTNVDINVNKATPIISTFNMLGWTYGEKPNSPSAYTNFGKIEFSIYDSTKTNLQVGVLNAGTYYCKAYVPGTDNYNSATQWKEFTVSKAEFDISGVTWDYENAYIYDGNEKEVLIDTSTLPEGLSVCEYENNKFTNAGTYQASVSFTYDSVNYESPGELTLDWEIVKASYDFTNVVWSFDTFVYDGSAHCPVITSGLPEGVSVATYNGKTNVSEINTVNVGKYSVTAHLSYDENNFNEPSDLVHQYEILKATYNMSGVSFSDETITYDGSLHSLAISGTLPNGVSVNYVNNGLTNVGNKVVTAKFTGDANNYNAISDMTATLTIEKAQAVITVNTTPIVVTYGNSVTLPVASSNFGTVTCNYKNDDLVTVGTYTVIYTVSETANYYGATKSLTVTINKATFDMSGVTWNYTGPFNFANKTYSVALNTSTLPEGVTLSQYTGTVSAYDAGTYTCNAVFNYDSTNYNEPTITDLSWVINKIDLVLNNEKQANLYINLPGNTYFYMPAYPSGFPYQDEVVIKYNGSTTEPSTPGNYDVEISLTGNQNYNDYSFTGSEYLTVGYSVTYSMGDATSGTLPENVIVYGDMVLDNSADYELYKAGYTNNGWNVNNGTNTVVYTNDGINILNVTSHLTVTPYFSKDISIDITEQIYTYNGSAIPFDIVNATDNLDDFVITYSGVGNSYHSTNAPVNAGTYNLVITREADATYTYFYQVINSGLIINSLDITNADITFSNELTYNGQEQTILISTVKVGEVVVDDYTILSNSNKATNYSSTGYTLYINGKGNFTGIASKVFYVSKMDVTVVWDKIEYAYNGNIQTVTAHFKDENNTKVDLNVATTGDFKDVGTYQFNASFIGTVINYNLVGPINQSIEMKKGQAEITSLSLNSWIYSQEAKVPSSENNLGTVTYTYSDSPTGTFTNVMPTNAGKHYIKGTIAGTTNYDGCERVEEFEILKATYNMSGINFNGRIFTYNGSEHNIYISGTLPEGVTVSYEGNGKVIAGNYTVTAKFAGDPNNYEAISNMTALLQIEKAKATIDVSSIVTEYVYDGASHTINSGAVLNHNETTLVYTNNTFKDVAIYSMAISAAETTNYKAVQVYVYINVSRATAVITINDIPATYTYLPSGITINSGASLNHGETTLVYTNNVLTDVGSYTITISSAQTSNYTAASITCNVTVIKADATIDTTNVVKNYTYSPEGYTVNSGAELNHSETELVYTNNTLSDVGEYNIVIVAAATKNYNAANTSVKVNVNKAQASISTTGMQNSYSYTGSDIVIDSGATLNHNETTLVYTNNVLTDVKKYTITISAVATKNYEATSTTFDIYVNKASNQIHNLSMESWTYGETQNTPSATADFGEITYTIIEMNILEEVTGKLNAGYYMVRADVEGTSNYNDAQAFKYFYVYKATYDMSQVIWTNVGPFTYDGNEHVVSVIGGYPGGVSVDYYTGNKATNAGSYTARVYFNYDKTNYNEPTINALSWKIEKANYDLSNVEWTYDTETYIGWSIETPKVVSGLPSGVSVKSYQAFEFNPIDVGNYSVDAVLNYDETNYNNPGYIKHDYSIVKANAVITVDESPIVKDYDGISVEIPEAISNFGSVICYMTLPEYVNVGEYSIIYTVVGTDNYYGDSVTVSVTINKVSAEITDFEIEGWTYGEAPNMPSANTNFGNVVYTYCDSATGTFIDVVPTTAGTYYCKADVEGTDNYYGDNEVISFVIAKATAIIETLNVQKYYVYTGSNITVDTGATLNHAETTLVYTNNVIKEYGKYNVTISAAETDNYLAASETVEVTVGKAVYDMSGVVFADDSFVYDGNAHSLAVSGILPEGVSIDCYVNNGKIVVGEYEVKVYFTGDSVNYEPIEPMTATLTITKANYDITGMKWNYENPYIYDGNAHSVELINIPTGVTVEYSNNTKVNAGDYVASVTFTYDEQNYNAIIMLDCNWSINKAVATIDVSGVQATYTYDGNEITINSGATLNHNETGLVYSNNKFTNAGPYTVTISAAETTNYLGTSANVSVIVNKAQAIIDTDNIQTVYTYDGNEITVSGATLNHNEIELVYEDNEFTNAGTYTVIITAPESANYSYASTTVEVTVNKAGATIDISGIQTEYTYTGEQFTINSGAVLSHNETEVVYEDNVFTNAGTYTVKLSAPETDNYCEAIKTIVTIKVKKATATIDTSVIQTEYTYDGNEITVTGAVLNHSETELVYKDYKFTNAGTYTVTITALETSNYLAASTTVNVTVNKATATIDTSAIQTEYTYDGNEITVSGAVLNHSETELVYENYQFTNANTYTVTISAEETTNYLAASTNVIVLVKKAIYDMSTITFENKSFVYDGNAHSLSIEGFLPEGVSVSYYENNNQTVVGEYKVAVYFTGDSVNYWPIEPMDAKLIITKANYDISEMAWNYTDPFVYDGLEHSVSLDNVPEGVTAIYSNNTKVNAGDYIASVTFEYDEQNYNGITMLDCEWSINKAETIIDISAVQTEYTYDGNEITVSGATINHDEVRVLYDNYQFTNAGTYEVKIWAEEGDNYLATSTTLVYVTVKKATATIDTSAIQTEYTYDGNEITVTGATLNHEETTLNYSGNVFTNANTYEVTISAEETTNYLAASTKVNVTVKKATATIDTSAVQTEYTYTGSEIVVNSGAVLNHSECELVYTNNKFTESNIYLVTITAEETTNYNSCVAYIEVAVGKTIPTIDVNAIQKVYTYTGKEIVINSGAVLSHNECELIYINNNFTNAGIYNVTISSIETDNFFATSTMVTIIVNKAEALIDTKDFVKSYVYTGSILVNSGATLNHEETELVYSYNELINVGKYGVVISAAETANYLAKQVIVEVEVTRADSSIDATNVIKTYTYDGSEHSINTGAVLSHNECELSYSNNVIKNAGKYTITISAEETTNYNACSTSIEVEVIKADSMIDVSNVPTVYTYTGSEIAVVGATLNHNEKELVYVNNYLVDAGTYTVTISVSDSDNYNGTSVTLEVTVNKAIIDTSSITWEYSSAFTYDGTEKAVYVVNVPEGYEVVYTNNKATNAGTYVASVEIICDEDNYEPIPVENLTWVINKQEVVLPTQEIVKEYTGKVVTDIIANNELININATDTIEVGKYNVPVTLKDSKNYKWSTGDDSNIRTIIVEIIKAENSISDISISDWSYGEESSTPVATSEFGTIIYTYSDSENGTYTSNVPTEAGTYYVKASVSETENYRAAIKTKRFVIKKAKYDMSDVQFMDGTYVYDGNKKSLGIIGVLPEGVTSTIYNNEKIDVGTYTITVRFTSNNNNYESIPDMHATLTITKATYDMSGISFNNLEVGYNALYQSIYVSGVLPEGMNVKYYLNDNEYHGSIEIGTYEITAKFSGDYKNYEYVNDLHATLNIVKGTYDLSNVCVVNTKMVYDGTIKMLALFNRLPSDVYARYYINGEEVTNIKEIGDYNVTVKLVGDSVHYNEIEDRIIKVAIVSNQISSSLNELGLPNIVISCDTGFDNNLSADVVIFNSDSIKENSLMIDYNDISDYISHYSESNIVKRVYGIDLYRMVDGQKVKCNVNDLGDTETIKVKIYIPEDIDVSFIKSILHVHSEDDIQEIKFDINKLDENRYYEIEINKLSEFAIVYNDIFYCKTHVALIALLVLFVEFVLVCWFVLGKHKFNTLTITGFAIYACALIVLSFFLKCKDCYIFLTVDGIALFVTSMIYLLNKRDENTKDDNKQFDLGKRLIKKKVLEN